MDSRVVRVHPRVPVRHPDVSVADVQYAFNHIIRSMRRPGGQEPTQYLAVGNTADGRILEMLAVIGERGEWFVYHAMKATRKSLLELGLI